MAKSSLDKIASYEEQISQLHKRRKQEVQKMKQDERKARTKRLCSRHGLLEKFMPDLATITDEQFEVFIKAGIDTTYGRNKLAEIVAKAEATAAQQTAETAAQSNATPKAKPPQAQAQNNGNHNANRPKSTPQTQAAESDKSNGGAMVEG